MKRDELIAALLQMPEDAEVFIRETADLDSDGPAEYFNKVELVNFRSESFDGWHRPERKAIVLS